MELERDTHVTFFCRLEGETLQCYMYTTVLKMFWCRVKHGKTRKRALGTIYGSRSSLLSKKRFALKVSANWIKSCSTRRNCHETGAWRQVTHKTDCVMKHGTCKVWPNFWRRQKLGAGHAQILLLLQDLLICLVRIILAICIMTKTILVHV